MVLVIDFVNLPFGLVGYGEAEAVLFVVLLRLCDNLKDAFEKLPWVDPGLPPARSNSFEVIPGAYLGQAKVPCLWSGSLKGWPQVHDVTTRG